MTDKEIVGGKTMYDTKSHLLAKRARQELQDSGTTTVICERCKESPRIIITPRGERTIVTCKCGFVYDAEINL